MTSSTSPLPINIGITGHRDIPADNIPRIKSAIKSELTSMAKRYPNTTINILCGLATGADQIVASVALENNFNVIAVFPFAVDEYERDFDTTESLTAFRSILGRCSDVIICDSSGNTSRDDGYVELGRTLVRCCDIVFALWDGETERCADSGGYNPLPGGTADVVHMCVDGILDDNSLLFAKPNQTYCKWLVVNQAKHETLPENIKSNNEIGTWKPLPIEDNQDEKVLLEILHKIERFNLESKSVTQQAQDTSVSYLIGDTNAAKNYESIAKLIHVYSLADCLAQAKQKQRLLSLKVITFLSFFAIAAQQVYAGISATLGWFTAHMILVIAVVAVYRVYFATPNSREIQFVEWRVFAENLRVQIFWHIAGLSDNCANNFRTTKLNEMDWIVDNLNKLTLTVDPPSDADVGLVRQHWITAQCAYFNGVEHRRGRAAQLLVKSKQYKRSSWIFFILAVFSMSISMIKIQLDWLPMVSEDMFFLIIALLFILSALLKTHSEQMGFEELSHRYTRTGYFFQQAKKRMTKFDQHLVQGSDEHTLKCQSVIKTIGIEALSENAAWLQLHKINAYEVQIN